MEVAVILKFLWFSGATAVRRCCDQRDRLASFFDQMNYCLSILIHRNTLKTVHLPSPEFGVRGVIGRKRALFGHMRVIS